MLRLLIVTMTTVMASCNISGAGGSSPVAHAGNGSTRSDTQTATTPAAATPATPSVSSPAAAPAASPAPASPSPATPAAQLTKYPIVFHHGFMGSSKVGSYKAIADVLTQAGYKTYLTDVSPTNSIQVRATQLAGEIDQILAESGATKVNIVAHSMGGLDARYLISTLHYGDRIASLSTMSTPHHGTPLADTALNSSETSQDALANMLNLMGRAIAGTDDAKDNDTKAAVHDLTVAYVDGEFNQANPNVEGVYYQSWGASTGPGSGDQIKTMMLPSWTILRTKAGDNDGVVPSASAQWGEFKGVLAADHLDLVGLHLLDLIQGLDVNTFYQQLAGDLAQRGF